MSKYRVSNKRKELYRLTYTIYDFYDSYLLKDKIDKKIFIALMKDFFKESFNKVLIDRKRFTFPYTLGTHRIKKRKLTIKTKPKLDFQKTKRLGVKVYFTNKHTNGYYFRWYWDKEYCRFRNKKFYGFDITKTNKALLGKEIMRCSKDPFIKDYDALT